MQKMWEKKRDSLFLVAAACLVAFYAAQKTLPPSPAAKTGNKTRDHHCIIYPAKKARQTRITQTREAKYEKIIYRTSTDNRDSPHLPAAPHFPISQDLIPRTPPVRFVSHANLALFARARVLP